MTPTQAPVQIAQAAADPSLLERLTRIGELRQEGVIDAQTAFGMLFFRAVESGVKTSCRTPTARAAYDAVKDAFRLRTLARGYQYAQERAEVRGSAKLDERAWGKRGLALDPRAIAGFVQLLEGSARAAGEATDLDPVQAFPQAFLDFVQMKLAVTCASGRRDLGGYPDSAHFFSFAELSLCRLEQDPTDLFWLELARGAVAAQPIYLAAHYLAGRRAPRSVLDFGPADLLGRPEEVARRVAAGPDAEDLSSANGRDLAGLVGRNAHRGFLG